jgi:hypothetical protein
MIARSKSVNEEWPTLEAEKGNRLLPEEISISAQLLRCFILNAVYKFYDYSFFAHLRFCLLSPEHEKIISTAFQQAPLFSDEEYDPMFFLAYYSTLQKFYAKQILQANRLS